MAQITIGPKPLMRLNDRPRMFLTVCMFSPRLRIPAQHGCHVLSEHYGQEVEAFQVCMPLKGWWKVKRAGVGYI